MSLLVAFGAFYIPLLQTRRDNAEFRARDVDEKWKAKRLPRKPFKTDLNQWEDDFAFATMFARYSILPSQYRDRLRLFSLLLLAVSVTIGLILIDTYWFVLSAPSAFQIGAPLTWLYFVSLLSPFLMVGDIIIIVLFVILDVAGGRSTLQANKKMTQDYIWTNTGFLISYEGEDVILFQAYPVIWKERDDWILY